jgi:hypothetical protein
MHQYRSTWGDVPSCDGIFGHFIYFTLFDEQEVIVVPWNFLHGLLRKLHSAF